MKKILLAALAVIVPVFFFGCEQKTTTEPDYGGSLNLPQMENWVRDDVPNRDQKILHKDWQYLEYVRKTIFRNRAQLEKMLKIFEKRGYSKKELENAFSVALRGYGRSIKDIYKEDSEYYYAVYLSIKENTPLTDIRFAYLTEGKWMLPRNRDSLEVHRYFEGVKELAAESRAY